MGVLPLNPTMKYILTAVCALLLAPALYAQVDVATEEGIVKPDYSRKADAQQIEKAKRAALTFINACSNGYNVDSFMSVCTVPFALDRKEIVSDRAVLRQRFIEMGKEKHGASFKIKKVDISIASIQQEILLNVIPIDVYLFECMFVIKSGKRESTEGAVIAVQMTPEPKIVGISD